MTTAQPLAEMTGEFLDTIFASAPNGGYFTGAVGHGGFFNAKGKYDFTSFVPFAYVWPAQRDEAVAWVQKWAPTADVYHCPYLQKTRERKKGNAAWRQLVHSDVDGLVDAAKVADLGGFVLDSGSDGHGHAYVLLTHTVMPHQHEALCRGLTAYLDGDKGKISDNDLLRPAGATNRKPLAAGTGPAERVVPNGAYPAAGVDPFELARKLGIDINAVAPSTNGQQQSAPSTTAQVDPADREVVDLSRCPSVAEALMKQSGDRSDDTYFIVASCRENGLSLAQARTAVDTRADLKDRLASRGDDDVLTCWNRHAANTAWAMPAGGVIPPSPPPPQPPGTAAPPVPPGPGRFFGRTGLRALDLALEVMAGVECGFGPLDERFYVYEDGVWTAGEGPIEQEITRLLQNRYRLNHTKNVTTLIKYQPDCARIVDAPMAEFINVPNGMIHWETGTIVPHNPAFLSTVQLPVEFVPNATCPQFEKYLREVLPPELVDSGFIWELIGYTLYCGNPLHVAVLLFGKGRNGKGTFIRVLKCLLGENNISTVSLHELTENKFRVATLYQKLANLAGDLDSKWLENTALFKKITGHDGIQGEYKYGASFEFDPWALPIYSANKAFGSPDSSEGWVARWVVVPFPNSFLGREDRTLDAKLTSESELRGILAKAVAALPALMARGNFADLPELAAAKTAFVIASDAVRAWLDECCVMDPAAWTPRLDLWKAYSWHSQDGSKKLSQREFYNRVEQVGGIVATKRGGYRGFLGVQIGAGYVAGQFAGQGP